MAYDIIGLQICDMPINAVGDMEVMGVANITRITDIIMPAFLFTAACIQGAMQPLDQTFRRRLRTQIGAHHRDERPLLRIATGFGIETLMPTVTHGFNAFGIAVPARERTNLRDMHIGARHAFAGMAGDGDMAMMLILIHADSFLRCPRHAGLHVSLFIMARRD